MQYQSVLVTDMLSSTNISLEFTYNCTRYIIILLVSMFAKKTLNKIERNI